MMLKVHQLPQEEIYLDFVRIPEKYRLDRHGRRIEEGSVCALLCGGEEVFVIARGCSREEASISLDGRTRDRLKVEAGKAYEFEISRTDFCGQVRWALEASDIRYSFSARIALVSAALGVLSILIASIFALVQSGLFR
jgi:hypothetical protein